MDYNSDMHTFLNYTDNLNPAHYNLTAVYVWNDANYTDVTQVYIHSTQKRKKITPKEFYNKKQIITLIPHLRTGKNLPQRTKQIYSLSQVYTDEKQEPYADTKNPSQHCAWFHNFSKRQFPVKPDLFSYGSQKKFCYCSGCLLEISGFHHTSRNWRGRPKS
jgi:hypothetical protein